MINGRAEGVNHSLIANFRRKKVGRGAESARKKVRVCAPARADPAQRPSPAERCGE